MYQFVLLIKFTSNYELQTSDNRLQTRDNRFQTRDNCVQNPAFILKFKSLALTEINNQMN